jgi:nucleotidyltransferase/DNA polymerase involved in DNA repair
MHNPLLQVKGVGPATAEHLAAAGITTIEALAAVTVEQLAGFPGFGDLRARQVIAHAEALLADTAEVTSDDGADPEAPAQPSGSRQPPDLEDSNEVQKGKGGKKANKEKKKKKEKLKEKRSKKEKGESAKVKKACRKKKQAKKKKK